MFNGTEGIEKLRNLQAKLLRNSDEYANIASTTEVLNKFIKEDTDIECSTESENYFFVPLDKKLLLFFKICLWINRNTLYSVTNVDGVIDWKLVTTTIHGLLNFINKLKRLGPVDEKIPVKELEKLGVVDKRFCKLRDDKYMYISFPVLDVPRRVQKAQGKHKNCVQALHKEATLISTNAKRTSTDGHLGIPNDNNIQKDEKDKAREQEKDEAKPNHRGKLVNDNDKKKEEKGKESEQEKDQTKPNLRRSMRLSLQKEAAVMSTCVKRTSTGSHQGTQNDVKNKDKGMESEQKEDDSQPKHRWSVISPSCHNKNANLASSSKEIKPKKRRSSALNRNCKKCNEEGGLDDMNCCTSCREQFHTSCVVIEEKTGKCPDCYKKTEEEKVGPVDKEEKDEETEESEDETKGEVDNTLKLPSDEFSNPTKPVNRPFFKKGVTYYCEECEEPGHVKTMVVCEECYGYYHLVCVGSDGKLRDFLCQYCNPEAAKLKVRRLFGVNKTFRKCWLCKGSGTSYNLRVTGTADMNICVQCGKRFHLTCSDTKWKTHGWVCHECDNKLLIDRLTLVYMKLRKRLVVKKDQCYNFFDDEVQCRRKMNVIGKSLCDKMEVQEKKDVTAESEVPDATEGQENVDIPGESDLRKEDQENVVRTDEVVLGYEENQENMDVTGLYYEPGEENVDVTTESASEIQEYQENMEMDGEPGDLYKTMCQVS
ncbi:unnamed protein product [Bursaphelenchus okinawaensis]|uniref:Zinc finger PHD-type domain-containing protein n=1 Tax=Bursaphelenchus okinawaensis TaxID=465554 RepID=A0A811L964_9BILA|nr:unnamed protein product [Bursaphelenchus okinawaensis]CAG9118417.1 unnamed protein product [Bursaphelenchus okinawaensis]